MMTSILLFPSNSGTMVATRALKDSGVTARMMPIPAGTQSSSNLCLSVEHDIEAAALAVLKSANIDVTAVLR
jgi:hypothetical protein